MAFQEDAIEALREIMARLGVRGADGLASVNYSVWSREMEKATERRISPAPWSFLDSYTEPGDFRLLVDAEGRVLITTTTMEDITFRNPADAALVLAAPDLYAACKAVLAAFDGRKTINFEAMRNALAKAEGR